MAQTRRKRRSKHRGTAAGSIEARGRTGRPLSADEKKKLTKAEAREKRLNTPPTLKGSATTAGLAAVLMFGFIFLTAGKSKNKLEVALLFAVFAFGLYTFTGYYLNMYMYRRRQRKKAEAGEGQRR
jgi:hypothetical protein